MGRPLVRRRGRCVRRRCWGWKRRCVRGAGCAAPRRRLASARTGERSRMSPFSPHSPIQARKVECPHSPEKSRMSPFSPILPCPHSPHSPRYPCVGLIRAGAKALDQLPTAPRAALVRSGLTTLPQPLPVREGGWRARSRHRDRAGTHTDAGGSPWARLPSRSWYLPSLL